MLIHKPIIEDSSQIKNNLFSKKFIATVVARQALFIYLKNLDIQNFLVPRFLPEGVYAPLKLANKTIHYYDYSRNFEINFDNFDFNKKNFAIHYIHPFGLYIKKNVDLLRKLKANGSTVIDDRALTLPIKNYVEFANATLYSLYKSAGIPYGGILFTDNNFIDLNSTDNFELKNKMKQNLNFYGNPNLKNTSSFKFRILNKIYGNSLDYSGLVSDLDLNKPEILDLDYINKLNYVDFDAISKKRIEIAMQYFEKLPKNLLWIKDIDACNTQSLIGFPIICNNPFDLYKKLMKKNIHSFILNKGWWFDNEPTNHLYKNHLLLPINYHFSEKDIDYIVYAVKKML